MNNQAYRYLTCSGHFHIQRKYAIYYTHSEINGCSLFLITWEHSDLVLCYAKLSRVRGIMLSNMVAMLKTKTNYGVI